MHLSSCCSVPDTVRSRSTIVGRHACQAKRGQLCARASASGADPKLQAVFRPATDKDMDMCRQLVWEERMNPLGVNQRHLVIASCPSSGDFLGMGQLVPLAPGLSELQSMVVQQRHRGKGIGSALLRHLCSETKDVVCLTTISKRAKFYERQGFQVLPFTEVPKEMVFEAVAGVFVARLFANDQLIVMQRRPG